WMTVACQGTGASSWYPCKDHQSDEPDEGASLSITVPDTLTAVANGRLVRKQPGDNHQMTYTWEVINPINNYNLIPYIGKYVHWSETYAGEKGPLDCTYWVLDYDLLRAREQFKQVPVMLRHFEYWLGPYPFYEDGYKLVQAPHLGMEHQSAVAYGNHFQNGYLGRDLSSSGWGNKWDFIIIHESGHEWFGNNLTTADLADMWVHEGFTNYLETLFTTREYGVEAGNDYVIGTRKLIRNNKPIIAPYGVNQEGSGDMYYKGGNLIHMIRTILNNDEQFRQLLRTMQQQWYHRIITSAEAEDYISRQTGINFAPVFDQYLRTVQIPQLQIRRTNDQAFIRWGDCLPGFEMSVKLQIGKDTIWVHPTTAWSPLPLNKEAPSIAVDRNFYVTFKTWTSTASD
ncbi:MAG: M1 family metallopeptidase, partial [Chitinophagaceae bacterium]